MNRIFTTALVAMFILAASIPSFAQSAIDINGIKISASGGIGFIASHEKKGNADVTAGIGDLTADNLGYTGNHDNDEVEYVISLQLQKTFSTNGTAFINIKGGGITGSAPLALGWFRSGVDDDSYVKELIITELHYTQPLGDLWSIKVGKFGDAGSPNDVASSVGAYFLGDPTIPGPRSNWENPYGVQLDYSPIELLTIEYQYLTQAYTHDYSSGVVTYDQTNTFKITRTPYNVLFVNFKPIENGNYRIGYWRDTAKRQYLKYRQGTLEDGSSGYIQQGGGAEPQGIFLSFDQQIIENLSAFLRGGYRLDETIGTGSGQAKTSWQIGAKVGGAFWGRVNDSIFIAIGQAQAPENIEFFGAPELKSNGGAIGETQYGVDYEKPKAETHFELNYSLNVNEQVSLVFFGQYVGDIYAARVETGEDGDVDLIHTQQDYGYAGGLKLVLAF
jgi:hypothetical protein